MEKLMQKLNAQEIQLKTDKKKEFQQLMSELAEEKIEAHLSKTMKEQIQQIDDDDSYDYEE